MFAQKYHQTMRPPVHRILRNGFISNQRTHVKRLDTAVVLRKGLRNKKIVKNASEPISDILSIL